MPDGHRGPVLVTLFAHSSCNRYYSIISLQLAMARDVVQAKPVNQTACTWDVGVVRGRRPAANERLGRIPVALPLAFLQNPQLQPRHFSTTI